MGVSRGFLGRRAGERDADGLQGWMERDGAVLWVPLVSRGCRELAGQDRAWLRAPNPLRVAKGC